MLSEAEQLLLLDLTEKCLNPCYNGICSLSEHIILSVKNVVVLILVIMEYAL